MFLSTTKLSDLEEAPLAERRPGGVRHRLPVPGAGHCTRVLLLLAMLSCAPACQRTPQYVFIDGGAHLGETVAAFEKSKLFRKHPWKVVSFEPNPELVQRIPPRPYLTVMSRAIWDTDAEIEFHFSPLNTPGGSVVATFVPQPEMKAVKVQAIDFGRWLKQNYRKDDVIYVKMDIEGAEYPVLEKMLRDGSMTYVDKLYIEFHAAQQAQARGGPGPDTQLQVRQAQITNSLLIEAITGLGVAVSIHFTMEEQGDYFNFDPDKYGQPW
jgi:FkbM family methyltransferase